MIKTILGARQRELAAWDLIQHTDKVIKLLVAKDWENLIPFAEAVSKDAPIELAATDQALFRTLRKAITEVHIKGLALDVNALKRLAKLKK